jgi:hypothetical protein
LGHIPSGAYAITSCFYKKLLPRELPKSLSFSSIIYRLDEARLKFDILFADWEVPFPPPTLGGLGRLGNVVCAYEQPLVEPQLRHL